MSTRSFVRVLAALTVPLVATAFSTTAWAATPGLRYVALGDSYAAGTGAGSYITGDTSGCYRSTKGYPWLIAAAGGYALDYQACSGAVIADVEAKQLPALTDSNKPAAAMVTVTVGGNDLNFASTMSTCLGTNTTACLNAVNAAEAKIADPSAAGIPARLTALFTSVKTMAPSAKIVATAYPKLFNGKDCSLLTSFTSGEMTALNTAATHLATATADAAKAADIGFAVVQTPFTGHEVCSSSPWINNVKLFSQYESFHPNANGYLYGYKAAVTTALNASTTTTTPMTVTTGGKTSSDTTRGTVKVKG